MKIGKKIREFREQNGLSQNNLARMLLLSKKEIKRWELDKSIPSKKILDDLERNFGVEKDYFISAEDYEILEKEFEKKRRIKTILKIAKYPVIILFLIFMLQLAYLPRIGDWYEVDGNSYAVCENKGYFGDGVVEIVPSDSSVIDIPDTITVRKGIYFFKFKVKYVFIPDLKDKNVTINLPRYFEHFSSAYVKKNEAIVASVRVDFYKINVSPLNEKYDSRDDCGCLINSKTDTLIYSSESGFIPDGVKTISTYAYEDFFKAYKTRYVLPSSVETLEDYAFGSSYNVNNLVEYFDFGSVKRIGYGILRPTTCSNTTIFLPKTLESIHNNSLNSYRDIEQVVNVYYKGSKEDWEKVDIIKESWDETNIDNHKIKLYGNSKFYYYSEEKPSENGVYWHYDENNNPVVWE